MAKKQTLPQWDLSDLYKDINDTKIKSDFEKNLKNAQNFETQYRNKINRNVTSQILSKAFKEYEDIIQSSVKIPIYAHLVFAADSSKSENGKFLQLTQQKHVEMSQHLIFFELQLAALSDKKLKEFLEDKNLSKYKHYLEKVIAFKPHRLSEAEEKVLNIKSPTGRSAFIRLFDEELSNKKFKLGSKLVSKEEVLDLLHDTDRRKRKNAALALTLGLKEELKRLTFVTNILIQDKKAEDTLRKYSSPEESRHLDNEVYESTVELMSSVTRENYNIVADFYKFKKKILNVDKIYDYDRYAPVSKKDRNFSYKEAKEIILYSFSKFSKEYRDVAEMFFEKNWIDAASRNGKRGGAFCSYITTDTHPYVLVNYAGKTGDVLTLAHELGHGVNGYLARKNGYLNFDWPLTIAETSSVFAEMLVFDSLKEMLSEEERFSLYFKKVESIFATVFRQNAMYNFEQDLHKSVIESGEMTSDQISELWIKRQNEMYKDSVELTENYKIWWSYIPHFLHTPFYVYSYAFGEILSLSLYNQYQKDKENFPNKFMQLLKNCGTASPDSLLKPLGINLSDKSFWQGGFNIVEDFVYQTKSLSPGTERLGKITAAKK